MPINEQALRAARLKLNRVKFKLDAMNATGNVDQIADLWTDFVNDVNKFYTKLIRVTNEDPILKKWFASKIDFRRADELLFYIEGARHVDEHGIADIATPQHGRLAIRAPSPGRSVYVRSITSDENGRFSVDVPEGREFIDVQQPSTRLHAPLSARGVTYPLPTKHLGKEITDTSPSALATLAYPYLESLFAEVSSRADTKS